MHRVAIGHQEWLQARGADRGAAARRVVSLRRRAGCYVHRRDTEYLREEGWHRVAAGRRALHAYRDLRFFRARQRGTVVKRHVAVLKADGLSSDRVLACHILGLLPGRGFLRAARDTAAGGARTRGINKYLGSCQCRGVRRPLGLGARQVKRNHVDSQRRNAEHAHHGHGDDVERRSGFLVLPVTRSPPSC